MSKETVTCSACDNKVNRDDAIGITDGGQVVRYIHLDINQCDMSQWEYEVRKWKQFYEAGSPVIGMNWNIEQLNEDSH